MTTIQFLIENLFGKIDGHTGSILMGIILNLKKKQFYLFSLPPFKISIFEENLNKTRKEIKRMILNIRNHVKKNLD